MKHMLTKKNLVICVLVLLTVGLAIEARAFVRANTKIILQDYQFACDAFSAACENIEEGEMTDEQIALEVASKAHHSIWQTRDLTKPLLISSKWYSHNLHNFLFECVAARDISSEELHALIDKMEAVSMELNKIRWTDVYADESLLGEKQKIFDTIQNVDQILKDYGIGDDQK